MAKKPQQNKIGESFEQNLPDELVPDFIWDNISNTLDSNNIPTESTESVEKIKASFEEGFDDAVVPPLLWTGIQSSLDHASTLNPSTESDNKIKTSFEVGHQDIIPENLWENVENELEVEGVWKRVLTGLNRRTKRKYWQEKGMQLSIAALALLLLRGCDFGEWSTTTPIANQSNSTTKVDLGTEQAFPALGGDLKAAPTNLVNLNAPTATANNDNSNNNLLGQTYSLPTVPIFSASSKTPLTANLEATGPIVAKKTNAFIWGGAKTKQADAKDKKNLNTLPVKNNVALHTSFIKNSKKDKIAAAQTNATLVNKEKNTSKEVKNTPSGAIAATKTGVTTVITKTNIDNTINNNTTTNTTNTEAQNTVASTTINTSKNPIDAAKNNTIKNTNSTSSKELLSETSISALIGQAFIDPRIETLYTFEINNVLNKKRHNIRFELGMNGKVGTSLLLGNATNQAMETTSMVKTKIRAAGGIGIMLDCYLTANDAIVFGVYPLSSSQQYFGGYTSEGRYYHKEVKLAYFDLTLGYQRTLFHYNDFGTIPSSMYARLDYGLGYLSKSEEIINGLAAELGDSYNKFNHNVGLTIGNTHRINRFVIDYGIYGNIGLSSVQNIGPSGTSSVEYNNLATMGGYLGLRYVL
ncbi:MAG: hypothetical protein ACI976_001920 [Aureispira sp.]|jgi:hypothetical protein